MNKIKHISKHCLQERMQQRGVSMKLIELISIYGECHRRISRGKHPSSLYFSKRSFEKMRRDGIDKQLMIEAERRPNLRFLIDEDSGSLITLVHVDKNKQRVH